MLGAYSAALPTSGGTASPIANNRPTTSTVNANNTSMFGGGQSNVLHVAVIAILVAVALLIVGRFALRNVRLA